MLAGTTKIAVLFPRPVPGAPEGLREACEWLSAATGGQKDPAGGIFPLGSAGNSQGSIDMGVLPNLRPGQRLLDSITQASDLTGSQMMEAAASGQLKALYVAGLDPAAADEGGQAIEALSQAGFLVVQDIFLTATAKLAHVVLPAASFAEKGGTLTNLERRVQRLTAAVPCPGQAKPDWQILVDVARSLGASWSYAGEAGIFEEIAASVPLYSGLRFDDLGAQGERWQHPGEEEGAESRNGHERRLWYQPLEPLGAEA